MAKAIKIPLKMKNGALVRTLEELKENFDIESLLEYYESGKLLEWLESRYYDEEAQKVSELERGTGNFSALLCESLGLEFEENTDLEFDSNFIKRRVEKREHLKTLTDDEEILSLVDSIAFTQEDLDTLIVMGEKKIYLCEGEFSVPISVPDMTYSGLFYPCAVIKATDNVNFKEQHIVFQDMPFFWDVSGLSESDQSYQAEKLFMEGRYKEAAEICEMLVEQDNPRALMLLYRISDDFLCHREKAEQCKEKGVKLNSAYSLLDKNQWKNISKHKEMLRKIAGDGTPFDKFYSGFLLYQEGFYTGKYDDEMIAVYQETADLGNPCAAAGLGNRYCNGDGVAQDYQKAFEWYRKAADQGDVDAQYNIGELYYYGKGVDQNYEKALEWYLKASEQNHALSQSWIGYMYENGQGVAQDYTKAVEWYRKVAEQGDNYAQCNIGYMYEAGRGVAQDYTKAVEWYRKAAEQGYARGQCNLGYMYEDGQGVAQDYTKAFEWYRKAAEQGFSRGQFKVGYFYDMGHGITQDYKKALEWYLKAAEQNHATAQNNIGALYENGHGVTKDYNKAMEWYLKAAEQGYGFSQKNIGDLYYNGLGVSRDLQEAKKWFQKAADNGNSYAKDMLNKL